MSSLGWGLDHFEGVMAALMMLTFVANAILRRSTPSRKEVDDKIAAVKGEVDAVKKLAEESHERLDTIEMTLTGLATKGDISDIKVMLANQDGDRRVLTAEVKGLREVFVRIEEPLKILMEAALQRERGS